MRALLVSLLLMAALPAQAARILTGSHPGFTRVTIPLAQGLTWQLGRTPTGYGIRFNDNTDFDLSRFFRRITRDRIAGVRMSGRILNVDLACLCTANAFVFRNRFLVVDIRDGAPGPDAQYESALDQGTGGGYRLAAVETPAEFALPLAEGVPAFRGVVIRTNGPAPAPPLEAPMPAQETRPSNRDVAQNSVRQDNLSPLELQVLETLSRAASQGLLDLAPSKPEARMSLSESVEEVNGAPPDKPARAYFGPPGRSSPDALPGLLAHTSLDDARTIVSDRRQHARSGVLCWPDEYTEVAGWLAKDADFGSSIGALRGAAMGELDRADPAGVLALARGYVYFGFGQEALQVLQIDGLGSRERLAVKAVANVVDNLQQSDTVLAGQAGCAGPASLWVFLVSEPTDNTSDRDVDEIVRQFKLLPAQLQVQLGPRLADKLLISNKIEMAEAVLQPAIRLEGQTSDVTVAETALALSRGQLAAATASLETMSDADPRMTPESVVQLVDLQITQNEDIPDATISLLESMQFEYRGQPVVAELMRARIAAMSQNGRDSEALYNLTMLGDDLPAPALFALQSTVIAGIVAQKDDMLFLDAAFRAIAKKVSPDVQNDVAQRLLDLGFPERATELLTGPAFGGVMAERRYLRAAAAMAMDDPDLAAAHLAGVNTARATEILEVAPAVMTASADTAWRDGNWSALSQSDDPLLQQASALEQAVVSPLPDAAAPLASGRALLEDSAKTKQTLDALMARFAAPTDG